MIILIPLHTFCMKENKNPFSKRKNNHEKDCPLQEEEARRLRKDEEKMLKESLVFEARKAFEGKSSTDKVAGIKSLQIINPKN